MTAFGILLRHYRRCAGLKQPHAAAKAGIDVSLWNRYETGVRRPPQRDLGKPMIALAKAVATPLTPWSIKYEMLCRSAANLSLISVISSAPIKVMVGLLRYLAPENPVSPGYLLVNPHVDVGAMSVAERLAGEALRRAEVAGFTRDDFALRPQAIVEAVFGLMVTDKMVDDAFAAFLFPDDRAVFLNPTLDPRERKVAITHELAHMLLHEGRNPGFEMRLDTLFDTSLFENPRGEKTVSWLAAAMLLPQPFPKEGTIELSVGLVEELAASRGIPPEVALSRLLFCSERIRQQLLDLSAKDPMALRKRMHQEIPGLSDETAYALVRRYPGVSYYW